MTGVEVQNPKVLGLPMEDLSTVPSNEGPGQNDAIKKVAEISRLIILLIGFHNTPASYWPYRP